MNAKPLSRWSCMRMAAVAIAATVLGCGGGGALPGQTASCTATLSGALSGTYDLNFTSVTNPISASNGKVYTTAGTLDATLPATSGTGATGTITVHVTF